MQKTFFTSLGLILWASAVFSQQIFKLEKWGKIPEEDLKMTHCSFDSSAASMILQETGSYELSYTRDGWRVVVNYRNRVKIFDESALDQGNLRIYYRSDRDIENFKDLDVQLISPGGEVQKVKSDNIFTEQVTESFSAKKVFIPNLQKGSIVEYRYELESAYTYTLYDTWYFQHDIPVRWSQVSVTIPQYFTYVYLMQAPRQFDLNENRQESVSPAFAIPYSASVNTYGLSNLPAIKEEPYITTLQDYRAHIGFQLRDINIPGHSIEKIMTSWPELAKILEEDEDFGAQYLKSSNFDKIWSAFRKSVPENMPKSELPEKVLRFVSTNMKWNGLNRCYPSASLDVGFSKKTGNTADLNLAVLALLRKLGFDVVPMFISTREHGRTYNIYPFVGQFNTVVAFLYDGDKSIVLDATNPYQPLGEIRGECYNGEGWLVDQKRPNWILLDPPPNGQTWFGNVKINDAGEMSGHFTLVLAGPSATGFRSSLEGEKEADCLKKYFATDYAELFLDSIIISDREALNKPLKLDFFCRIPNAVSIVNDFLYVKPVIDFTVTENPLKSLLRTFPVNLNYPIKANYVITLDIPNGYALEELPPPARISLPENTGKIQFSCGKVSDTRFQVVLKMNIDQLEFKPEEYSTIRQFFELSVDKVQYQIAIKKT